MILGPASLLQLIPNCLFDRIVLGKSLISECRECQYVVDADVEDAIGSRDQGEAPNVGTELEEQLLRQAHGLRLVSSLAAILDRDRDRFYQ